MDTKQIQQFIKEKEDQISEFCKNLNKSYWRASLSGKKEDYEEYAKEEIKLKELLSKKEDFEKLKNLKEEKTNEILDRQIKLLYYTFLSNQGNFSLTEKITKKVSETELKFNTFRAEINGKNFTENEIKEILKKETDNKKLKEAWTSIKRQGKLVEKDILEIVELRNEKAKALGFENYYQFSLEIGEQNEQKLELLFKELENLTDKPFREMKEELDLILQKKYNIHKEELRPWHYGDPFFQEGPSVYKIDLGKFYAENILEKAVRYFDSVGLDVKEIVGKSDLYEKPGKNQHAYCIDIDRKGDVRTLQNIKNNENWMDTVLHEFGHGIYSLNYDKNLPWVLRDSAHTFTTEAVAMLFARKAVNSEFIKNYCHIKQKEYKEIKKIAKKTSRLKQLVFARWAQVMFHFERELYKNPTQDLNKLWWDLVKRFQMIDFSRDEPDWASKYHMLSAPVYYHNYLLGELLASQIHNFITKNFTKDKNSDYSNKEEVGKYFKEKIFSPGAKYRWDEMIEKATGEKLTAKYFVEEFAS
ncbi:MAG: M3 family metallopeptidase [Nanoarchaeota archaeon]|nr:M3 family metallopeptidase [Nanoarchaeota archaeon]